MHRDRIAERLGHRYLRHLVTAMLVLIVAIGGLIVWNVTAAMQGGRTTIIIASDPMYVASWDDERHHMTVFTLPGDIRVDGARGVGNYPVRSLSKLEVMDKTKRGLLRLSLEDALGLPITGVVEGGNGDGSPVERVKNALSPFSLPAWRGGFPMISLRFGLWRILTFIRPDEVTIVDLSVNDATFKSETLPDGSVVRKFDESRFDTFVGQTLEEDAIRKEGLRVRIANTTDMVGLGNRAARIVSHAGMVVVMVESDTPAQKECSLTAKKSLWGSTSVSFMKTFFHCSVLTGSEDEQADITIRLGQDYARRFLPE